MLHPSLPAATQTHNLQVLSYDIIIISVVEKGRTRDAGEQEGGWSEVVLPSAHRTIKTQSIPAAVGSVSAVLGDGLAVVHPEASAMHCSSCHCTGQSMWMCWPRSFVIRGSGAHALNNLLRLCSCLSGTVCWACFQITGPCWLRQPD